MSNNQTDSEKDSAKPVWWVLAIVVLAIVGFAVICTSVIYDLRKNAWALAGQNSENLAATMDGDISRNIELYDLSLRAVVTNLAVPELADMSQTLRHLILFDHAATAKHFGPLKVYNQSGDLLIDSSTLMPSIENIATENAFQAQMMNFEESLFIDKPTVDKAGVYRLLFSRRFLKADHSFGGVVTGSIELMYFYDLFNRVSTNKADSLTLMERDGTVVMRVPFDLQIIGRDLSQGRGVKQVLGSDNGWFENSGAVDNNERLYVWANGKRPLITIVGKSLDDVYGIWKQEAARIAGMVAILSLLLIGCMIFLMFEVRKRTAAEAALAILARTDALTELFNRRKFDEVVQLEWNRALRSGQQLTLIMIDADHFKKFNDTFGHQAGDQVLKNIAKCLKNNDIRSGDCAARYGGEEFALVLPNTNSEGAFSVAERLRSEIAASDHHLSVTVSIGIATIRPSRSWTPEYLVKLADAALYSAKAKGRNQCVISDEPRIELVA